MGSDCSCISINKYEFIEEKISISLINAITRIQAHWRRLLTNKKIINSRIESITSNVKLTLYEQLGEYTLKFLTPIKIKSKKEYLYIGEINDNREFHGSGIVKTQNDYIYQGNFQNGKYSGLGRLIYPNGECFQGEFKNGVPYGKGIFISQKQEKFIMEIDGDTVRAEGEEKFEDGSYYKGEYLHNLKHGKGTFYSGTNGFVYNGDFKEDEFNGIGQIKFNNGDICVGEFSKNKINGVGIYIKNDVFEYIGEYINDEKSGFGIIKYSTGKIFKGYWLKGKRNGKGVMIDSSKVKYGLWRFGRLINKKNNENYSKEIKNSEDTLMEHVTNLRLQELIE